MAYSTIVKPGDYFNTKLYTGTGANQSVTGVGFQPDWVWIKNRGTVQNHVLTDSVRGVTKSLNSNTADAETTQAYDLTAFNSDGFTVNGDTRVSESGQTYVSWNWLANNTSGSSNTDGSISSTVSANTTSGFSIVKWIGTGSAGTIGHGLGAEPHVIIVKKLNSSESWFSYHKPLGNTGRLVLSTTDAVANDAGYWNSTTPTSSVFSVTSNGSNNASGDTYIAYCFAPKTGYSKFGSYVGNGNANGNFVYLGFKPAFLIAKNASSSGYSWELFDNKRNTTDGVGNVIQKRLYPDSSAVEGGSSSTNFIDFLSNGFKIRRAGDSNENGSTYIYMAFAEEPLVANSGTDGVPATAK
ncbi:hypothetical protein OAA60_02700 [Porticoccaceae bacterium]|nr:hypothetical protein [Porticoccaceae bacterium]